MNRTPLISIITVCYNAESEIRRTIQSVLSQDYKKIQYILIDGNSVDETMNIVKEYEDSIDLIITENDNGIYDAMNKGYDLSNGQFALFLNAGDIFEDKQVLKNVFKKVENFEDYHLIVGLSKMVSADGLSFDIWPRKNMDRKKHIPHQSVLINKTVFHKEYYDTKFQISGDREYFERLSCHYDLNVKTVDIVISNNILGGVSNNGSRELTKTIEDLFIINVYQNLSLTILLTKILKAILKNLVYRLFKKKYRDKIMYFIFHKLPRSLN